MNEQLFKSMNKDRLERIDKYNNKISEKRLTDMESICFEMRGEKQAIEVSDYILDLFNEALKALRLERDRSAELGKTLKLVVGMCESIGSFSNGVTWQGMDEGDVMAQKVIDDARKLIDGD